MRARLAKFLSQPYPFYYEGRHLLTITGILFLMSLFFNYLFEPFIVNRAEHRMNFFWICALHGAVSSLLFGGSFYLLSRIKNIEEKWKIREEILSLLIILIAIGIGQFLIRDIIYDNPYNWSWGYFFEEIRNTLLIGSLFIALFLPYNYNRLYKHNQAKAQAFVSGSIDAGIANSPASLFIQTQLQADNFNLDLDRFLFAKAEKNYMEIYLKNGETTEKLLKRITFKELEAQLAGFDQFCKTHRSYLVNLSMVKTIAGNAQGYRLTLKETDEIIPVSRSMIQEFERKISMYQ
ncbi:MAG: LytTR family transcriptional regulator [Cyclobacteriaceae bacterium]|nr:LytTR family transcriptional regulator [Cyclobacteriaceae bacterium]